MERGYSKVQITEKAEKSLRGGHPWIYDVEIQTNGQAIANGSFVDVYSKKERWLGTGLWSEKSKIRIRLVSRNANDTFDEAFWERRIRYAIAYRAQVMGDDFGICRLIFGEADQFPGWTVDLYHDVVVSQILSFGIEMRKDLLFSLLRKVLREFGIEIRALVERNDSSVRQLEGLTSNIGLYPMDGLDMSFNGKTMITENGLKYYIDCLDGQKTGYFLDQKYNRKAAASLAKGRKVLDCFTHTGAFGLNCAKAGAKHVTSVDISEDAVAMTRDNIVLNGLENVADCMQADVFDLLTKLDEAKDRTYEYIILDPPAFTKSRHTVENAMRGYREINRRAMSLLPRGGYLATCSCSHFMTDSLFRDMLHKAAEDASVSLRQIEARQQAPDHPILWNVPETDYLKFYLFQIV